MALQTSFMSAILWLGLLLSKGGCDFVSSWQTSSAPETITLPMPLTYPNISIIWGDGAQTNHFGGPINHTYTQQNYFTMTITGAVFGFKFNYGGDCLKIKAVHQWGTFVMDANSSGAFAGCTYLQYDASDQPTFLPGTELDYMFANTSQMSVALNWDLTNVVSLTGMFENTVQNQPLSFTNTGGVTRTDRMFFGAVAYNFPITWDTSGVQTMSYMFAGASNFRNDLTMNTTNVIDMSGMFSDARSFSNNLNFDTRNVKNMSMMFAGAQSYNINPSLTFNTSSVIDMSGMFAETRIFNSDIFFNNTPNLLNVSKMFYLSAAFNGNLLNFNTSQVLDFSYFLYGATAYQQIVTLDTRSALNFDSMFSGATSFFNFSFFPSTRTVTNMRAMFMNTRAFNMPLTSQILQTDNVLDMSSFLEGSSSFNSVISLNTGNVQKIARFLYNAQNFNSRISLDTKNMIDMSFFLAEAHNMNSPLNFTTLTNVIYMNSFLMNAYVFNQKLPNTNTQSLVNMSQMFYGATNFNNYNVRLILNTTLVTDMSYCFAYASSFNQVLVGFITINLLNASHMFFNATNFQQQLNLNTWNTSLVTDMNFMFYGVSSPPSAFQPDLSVWNTDNTQYCSSFCDYCSLPSFLHCVPCSPFSAASASVTLRLTVISSNASVCNCPDLSAPNGSFCTGSRAPTTSSPTPIPTSPTSAPSLTPSSAPSLAPSSAPSTSAPSILLSTSAPSSLPSSLPSSSFPSPMPTPLLMLTQSPATQSPTDTFLTPRPTPEPLTTPPTSVTPTQATLAPVSSAPSPQDLCIEAVLGPGLQSSCVTTPPTASTVKIPPNPPFVILSPILDITINSSELAGSTFVFTLPINPIIRQGIVTQNCFNSKISCAWQQPATGEFVDSGCDLTADNVNLGSGLVGSTCTCTHLTVFALVLRTERHQNALCQAETSDYVLLGLYGFLAAILLVQVCRLVHARLFGKTFITHVLLFLCPLLRIIYLVAKPVINSLAGLVFLGLAPSGLSVCLFIHLLLSWASIQLFSMKTSPFDRFRIPFIIIVICVILLTCGIVIAVAVATDPTMEMNIVIYGSYVLAALFAIVCILVLVSGLGLNRMLKENVTGTTSNNNRWRVLARYRVLFSTLGLSLCLLVEAALWIAAVQENILESSTATLATSTVFYILDWLSLSILTTLFAAGVSAAIAKSPRLLRSSSKISRSASSLSMSSFN